MLAAMKRSFPIRTLAPLAIALAAWAALPSLEWCPLSWKQCRAACESAPVAAANAGCDEMSECGVDTGCGGMSECGGAPTASTPLCDPVPDQNLPFGDRAWCIHPPVDGVPSRGIEMPAPSSGAVFALPASARDPVELPGTRIPRLAFAPRFPSCSDSRTRPPTRAPPLA